jgi:cob(I)alamin adenosyltransferase
MRGYIQVYTGNGKGKTTAALGMALRAAGAGHKVFFAQFMKGTRSSELIALEKLSDHITLRQYGNNCFINGTPNDQDIRAALEGLKEVRKAMLSGRYQVMVLDEANVAIHFNLFSVDDLLDLIRIKHGEVEIVITGRDADPRIIEAADLVTEMKEVKHYYKNGVDAREGIEK